MFLERVRVAKGGLSGGEDGGMGLLLPVLGWGLVHIYIAGMRDGEGREGSVLLEEGRSERDGRPKSDKQEVSQKSVCGIRTVEEP